MSTAPMEPTSETRRDQVMLRLFSALQIADFNVIYYRRRAAHVRAWSLTANIVAALSASGALVTILKQDSFGIGPWLLACLAAIAAVFAAIGPIFGFESKVSQLEKAALGHSIVMDRIKRLLKDIRVSELDASHLARELEIDAFEIALSALDESPSRRVKEASWNKAMEEFPSERAWTAL